MVFLNSYVSFDFIFSERNSASRSSLQQQLPTTQSTDLYNTPGVYGSQYNNLLNSAMLSFGPNGVAPPFNHPAGYAAAAAAAAAASHSAYPFGAELLPPFSNATNMLAASKYL